MTQFGTMTYGPAAIEGRRSKVLREILDEWYRADEHGRMLSPHEAIAVIREEYLELEREVFHGEKGNSSYQYRAQMRAEAIQLGAMSAKLIETIDADEALENYVNAPAEGRGGNAPGVGGPQS